MKVKESQQTNKEQEFEKNLSFEEWLDYYKKEPTDKEVNNMESTLHHSSLKIYSTNNPNYQPKKGA